jgi:hypothetical protein
METPYTHVCRLYIPQDGHDTNSSLSLPSILETAEGARYLDLGVLAHPAFPPTGSPLLTWPTQPCRGLGGHAASSGGARPNDVDYA